MDIIPNPTRTSYKKLRQNNVEDLYALTNDDKVRLFSEGEIKNYMQQYHTVS